MKFEEVYNAILARKNIEYKKIANCDCCDWFWEDFEYDKDKVVNIYDLCESYVFRLKKIKKYQVLFWDISTETLVLELSSKFYESEEEWNEKFLKYNMGGFKFDSLLLLSEKEFDQEEKIGGNE